MRTHLLGCFSATRPYDRIKNSPKQILPGRWTKVRTLSCKTQHDLNLTVNVTLLEWIWPWAKTGVTTRCFSFLIWSKMVQETYGRVIMSFVILSVVNLDRMKHVSEY